MLSRSWRASFTLWWRPSRTSSDQKATLLARPTRAGGDRGERCEPRHARELGLVVGERHLVREAHGVAGGKPGEDRGIRARFVAGAAGSWRSGTAGSPGPASGLALELGKAAFEELLDRRSDQPACHDFWTLLLALVDHFELAGKGRQQRRKVAEAGVDRTVAGHEGAALEIRGQELDRRDRHARRDPRGLVDELALPGCDRDLLDQQARLRREHDRRIVAFGPRLLGGDLGSERRARWIVGEDLRGDPVAQRGDDRAAVGVVLRVGGKGEQHVERQAHGEAADLEIALLEQVEQADLNARRKVGQLVDREDAAVGARDDAEVNDLGIGVGETAGRCLDRIDVAEQIGDRDIRRCGLLAVARFAAEPLDGGVVARFGDPARAPGRDRGQRIVVHLAAGEDRDLGVEERRELAQDPRLRLAPQTEKDEVVAREQGVGDRRNDRAVVADDAGEEVLLRGQLAPQIGADLRPYRARAIAGALELAEGLRRFRHACCASSQRSASMAALQPLPAAVTAWR